MTSNQKQRVKKRLKAIEYLGGCCWRCELTFHKDVYDIHHLNPNTKKYDWGELKRRKWSTIQEELDKCILLCANCHRLAHMEMRENALL
jgi:predicted HNH restriction endonuclease